MEPAFTLTIDDTTVIPKSLHPSIKLQGRMPSVCINPICIIPACIGDNCNYIAKILPIPTNYPLKKGCPTKYDVARNEIIISMRASSVGIGPHIQAASLSDDYGILIMDKYDGNFEELIYRYQEDRSIPVETILRTIFTLLTKLHQQGIRHRDLHPGNIFYKTDGTYVIADYGLAVFSDSAKLAQEDWQFFYEMVRTVREIKSGKHFANIDEIAENIYVPNRLHNVIWHGTICPDWS